MKTEKIHSSEFEFPFIAYIPNGLCENPAIVFQLHGAGERGDGINLDKVSIYGLTKTADDCNLKDMILILPQCPCDSFWAARVESIKRFIDKCVKKYNADPKKVFLCGMSMGGYGTWFTAMAYPNMFRAIAPCCGGGMPWNANVLTMPVWAFHGTDDDVVSPHETYDMVEALEKCGANVKHTYFEGVKHESWNLAFNGELLDWFRSFID